MKTLFKYRIYLLFLVFIAAYVTIISAEKHDKIKRMDRRELQYDADGDFILIDNQEGLMGVYKATKPIMHIWISKEFIPGLYHFSHNENRLEFVGNDITQSLALDRDVLYYLIGKISYHAPVMIY